MSVEIKSILDHAILTLVCGGGENGREVEQLAERSMCGDGLSKLNGVEISDKLRETNLVINNEECLFS
jgi:hypothetical protein